MTPEQLFENNQRLAYWVLRKRYPKYADDEDMKQLAMMGLWKACRMFDQTRGYTFSSLAATCVINEIRMNLRHDRIHYVPTVPINAPVYHDSAATLADMIPCKVDYAAEITSRLALDRAMVYLTPDERAVINAKLAGKTQQEIAPYLNYTQASVSRKYTSAKKKLAGLMG